MSASSSTSAFKANKCSSTVRGEVDINPRTSLIWRDLVLDWIGSGGSSNNQLEPELDKGPHHIRLCGLRRWEAGGEKAKGSGLHLEHFLHFRALVQRHDNEEFPLREMVESKYADAAELFLKDWQEFDNYIVQAPSNDPAIDVDSLGLFAETKRIQNQVLLGAYLRTSQDDADSFQDSVLETPLKKGRQGIDFNSAPPESDAADEQIVNEALISFASALTRRWMVQKTSSAVYGADETPTKGGSAGRTHGWKTAADWTMARNRFHIRERMRLNDQIQKAHMAGLGVNNKRKDDYEKLDDGHFYGRVMTSETDGSLYSIERGTTEILAIVEAKKRLRRKDRLKIEWQEAAEILAWLNLRLRDEANQRGGKGKGPLKQRRGMLKSKPAVGNSGEKYRCLLVAQDREEICFVIGEWDKLYEEYALDGRFSDASIKLLDDLEARKDPARLDAGFLKLHTYGPSSFGASTGGFLPRNSAIRKLSTYLLAMSLHLSQASCSLSSRRTSPSASIQLPTTPGKPCCPGCTCNCCCRDPTDSRAASKAPSETSDTRTGRRQGSREGSRPRGPSTNSTTSSSSHDSGRREGTPTRDPRPGARRPDEIRAASARGQQDPRPAQARGHDNLPLRGRRTAIDQQGSTSHAQGQPSRATSRPGDAAAAGHHGQAPAPGAPSRPPPLPQAAGGSGPLPGQQRQPQQQGRRDPPGQPDEGMQPPRDTRRGPGSSGPQHQGGSTSNQPQPQPQPQPQVPGQTTSTPQRPPPDPSSGPGPSYPTQAGPSSSSTPSGPPVPGKGGPSKSRRNPEEPPAKNDKKEKPLSPLKGLFGRKKRDKKD